MRSVIQCYNKIQVFPNRYRNCFCVCNNWAFVAVHTIRVCVCVRARARVCARARVVAQADSSTPNRPLRARLRLRYSESIRRARPGLLQWPLTTNLHTFEQTLEVEPGSTSDRPRRNRLRPSSWQARGGAVESPRRRNNPRDGPLTVKRLGRVRARPLNPSL